MNIHKVKKTVPKKVKIRNTISIMKCGTAIWNYSKASRKRYSMKWENVTCEQCLHLRKHK